MMQRLAGGVVVASVLWFVFGFIFWGLLPFPYTAWSVAVDEPVAIAALRTHFPARGTYFVPSRDRDLAVTERKFNEGPLAFVFLLSTEGRPMVDMRIMVKGYILSLVVLVLIAAQMYYVRASLPTFTSRLLFATVTGVMATIMIDLGDAVWWELPWDWKFWQAAYHLGCWVIAGLVFGMALAPRQTQTAPLQTG